jgi:hypothetical protein
VAMHEDTLTRYGFPDGEVWKEGGMAGPGGSARR